MKKFACCVLVLGLGLSNRVYAQKPYNEDVRKSALPSEDGYRERKKDERYEGLYTLKVGAPLLDVVSVTHGPISYELTSNEKLTILVPLLKSYAAVGVSGTSFGLNKNYRLDAVISPGGKKVIPVKEVLSPNYIYGRNLGIFGYIGEPQYPSLYVPVRASARPEAPPVAEPIRVVFLPGTTLEKLTWSYAKSVQGQCTSFVEQGAAGVSPPASGSMYVAHQPIVVVVPAASSLVPGDEVCLTVRFKALGDPEWRSKSLKLLITL